MKKSTTAKRPPLFSNTTLEFLNRLAQNNNREWFHQHKDAFETAVITPALDFIEAMAVPLGKISPHFLCIPKRVGGSLFRIYRDTRFAHDKRPYKTNIGIHFRHDANQDVHAPGYYLHIGIDECFIGCGMWRPERPSLTKIRTAIVERTAAWGKVRRAVARAEYFEFYGELLKRLPSDIAVPPTCPWSEDLKRRDFIVLRAFDEGALYHADLVDFVATTYAAATPLMKFLCETQGARF
ncbi:MAG: TIGR02453 family protein [Gammaproteobacteria bacterium]|nr:TIGR02453 family protein [Gammaproteobacteria bacterium]